MHLGARSDRRPLYDAHLHKNDQGGRVRKPVASVAPAPAAFVAVALPPPIKIQYRNDVVVTMDLQARLPNGVAIDLHAVELRHVGEVIKALGGCGVPLRRKSEGLRQRGLKEQRGRHVGPS